MESKQIESLRKIFKATLAAVDFGNTIAETFGGSVNPKAEAMRKLHQECLDEANKQNPDMKVIQAKLLEMEILAATPTVNNQFPKGGTEIKEL